MGSISLRIEFVSINSNNIAAVTLQENNAIVVVDLATASVMTSFDAGSVNLHKIDNIEDGIINQTATIDAVPREADGLTWIDTDHIVTADEGDMNGGSRGFTIYHHSGNVVYSSGNAAEQLVARIGHYLDERSENKGNEPENVLSSLAGFAHEVRIHCHVGSASCTQSVASVGSLPPGSSE